MASGPTTSAIDGLVAGFEALTGVPVDDLDTADIGDGIVAITRVIDGLRGERARWLRHFEGRNGHRGVGAASILAWTAHRCSMSPGAAAETVATARHLPGLHDTSRALRDGEIGYQHAAVIAHAARDLGDGPVREREAILVEAARALEVRDLRKVTAHLRDCLDPDGALRDANRDHERRRVHLGQVLDGMFHLEGWLEPECGAALRTALSALMAPLPEEHRTAPQRRHDALHELCIRQLHAGTLPRVRGQRPHLTLTVSEATLRGEPGAPGGELGWAGVVIRETAQRIACDALRTEMTVNGGGAPVELSRPEPTVRAHVRRTVVARDRGCAFSGCDRPPEWCDVHHIVPRAKHGPHTVDNLALVCRVHHRFLHEGRWRVRGRLPRGALEVEPP